jgi:hypothetical protein
MELTLGPDAGPKIVFEPTGRRDDLAAAADLAHDKRAVWSCGKRPEARIEGRGDQGILHLVGEAKEGTSLVDDLREIERWEAGRGRERGLAAIFAALLAADRGCSAGQERTEGAPAFFARVAEEREAGRWDPWIDGHLEQNVLACINDLVEGGGLYRPAAGPLDSARFWLGMGERLWRPEVRRRLGKVHLGETTRRILVMLAGSWMELHPEGWVQVRGSDFRLRGNARRLAWPQVVEWEAGEIDRRTLEYLTAYHTAFAFDGVLEAMLGRGAGGAAEMPPAVAARESRELLEEAALNWRWNPSGSFRVGLPERTPLSGWDVTSLRVWVLPGQGIWLALENDEQPGASLQWMVGPPHLRRWVLHETMVPPMHLTISALWRDLKVGGGEAVLVEQRDRAVGSDEGDLRLHGKVRWGSDEELKRILREAYPVEEHIRVLPPGKRASRRAYRMAASQGLVLKPGTTFVRGHQRGKPDETESSAPLKARGLARLMLASRQAAGKQIGARTR